MLQVVRTVSDGTLKIALSGAIDDLVDLGPVFSDLLAKVELDLRGVDRINSVGVRNWVELIGKLSARHQITIVGVSYPMVMQAICVRSFFGKGLVESCTAPYFCPRCNESETVVVHRNDLQAGLPEKKCSQCGAAMFFDELDHYFRVFESD